MPEPLVSYWTAWNSDDLDRVPGLVRLAVTEDVVWNDPRDSFNGRAALVANMVNLRVAKPTYRFVIASEIDHHNGRFRYRWDMRSRGRTLMEGLDIATLASATGLIERVDGFFGHPTPIANGRSGVPETLRR